MKDEKIREIIHETYKLLYKASDPSDDFDDICNRSKTYEDMLGHRVTTYRDTDGTERPINEHLSKEIQELNGYRLVIPYDEYFISNEDMDNIINAQIKKYKLKGHLAESFKITLYLGASPTFKPKEKTNLGDKE